MPGKYTFDKAESMPDDVVPQFVRVARGEFTLGADDGEEDERPAHRVVLDPYYISIHPVTNAHYASFVRDTGHPVPAVRGLPLSCLHRPKPTFASSRQRMHGAADRRRVTATNTRLHS